MNMGMKIGSEDAELAEHAAQGEVAQHHEQHEQSTMSTGTGRSALTSSDPPAYASMVSSFVYAKYLTNCPRKKARTRTGTMLLIPWNRPSTKSFWELKRARAPAVDHAGDQEREER
jgi:hypothetical protein